ATRGGGVTARGPGRDPPRLRGLGAGRRARERRRRAGRLAFRRRAVPRADERESEVEPRERLATREARDPMLLREAVERAHGLAESAGLDVDLREVGAHLARLVDD